MKTAVVLTAMLIGAIPGTFFGIFLSSRSVVYTEGYNLGYTHGATNQYERGRIDEYKEWIEGHRKNEIIKIKEDFERRKNDFLLFGGI